MQRQSLILVIYIQDVLAGVCMSFFSRLNNLVQGFSQDLQTRIEKNHPNIVQPNTVKSTTKELKEALSHFSILEQEIDIELQIANLSEKKKLQIKKREYQKEQEKIRSLISKMKSTKKSQIKAISSENEVIQPSIDQSPTTNTKRKRTL